MPSGQYIYYSIESAFLFGGGMFRCVETLGSAICGGIANFNHAAWWFGLPIGAGIVCYGLLFYLLRYEKGENAEQNSESWFGYKTLIPVYLALLTCTNADGGSLVLFLIAAMVATIVHKRTFRLKWKDVLPMACGFAAGLLLMIIHT